MIPNHFKEFIVECDIIYMKFVCIVKMARCSGSTMGKIIWFKQNLCNKVSK